MEYCVSNKNNEVKVENVKYGVNTVVIHSFFIALVDNFIDIYDNIPYKTLNS